ncbi:hypothetical protein Tco_0377097 [Tanacetum coccineum]
MDSSMGKMCLGKDVIKISSDRNEGSGDWDSPEYKDTTGSGGKKEPEALVFHKMDSEEDSDRSFLRSANAMVNFGEDTITIQPDFDPFLLSSDEEGNPNLDNLETFLDFDFDEVPQTETDLPPMVCKMGKGSRNKKKIMENIMYFNDGVGPSSSVGTPLTQEEAERKGTGPTVSRELIDSEDRLIPDILVDNVPRVAAQRTPRVQRALMQDLYERMGSMEIKQEAIERLEYR